MKIPPFLMLVAALSLMFAACGKDEEPLPGLVLAPESAPAIDLADSEGRRVSLHDYHGKPVVVSFLYTDCPDVCPVIGERIGQALTDLADKADDVAVLIVSVDPEGDTPEKAEAFLQKHGIEGEGRHYLLGDAERLAPVWLAYGVGAAPAAAGTPRAGEPVQVGRIGHTDATFLIDRDGKKRTLLRGDATADDIARGLRILLR